MSEPGLNDQAMPGDADKEAPIAVSPGARLAACRQERGWTIEQVAGQLNLAPRQVVAIEADDYPSLPGMAIVRGFVRQYAKLLKIDAAPLLASLGGETVLAHEPIRPRQNLSTPFSEARLPSMTNSRSKVSAKWIMAGIVVVAVGAVAYGLRQGVDFAGLTQSAGSQVKEGASQIITPSAPASQGDAAPSASDSAAAPEPVNAQPPVEPSAPSAGQPGEAASPQAAAPAVPPAPAPQQGGAATSQAAGTPAATGAAVPAPAVPASAAQPPSPSAPAAAAVPQAAPANTGNTLVIKARQDSWIEIKAAGSARPVISRVVKAGETESLEVTDTVAVVVGNASGVDATLRGNPVDLKATGNGNVARITLK